jgi:hypothetical protein
MGKSDFIKGLYVKDGRLINMRPDGETGIAKAADIKRAVDNDKKINIIAEAIQLADDKKKFNELEY